MLTLLSLLQTGRARSGTELAERLEASPRTVRRDVERLRELGYPVQTQPGPGGHYRLVAGTAMPPLLLDDDEAVAVAIGLRLATDTAATDADEDASTRALRKLEQVLPARLRHKVTAIHNTTETASTQGPTVSAELLSLTAAAAWRRERITFTHRARDGTITARRVDPYRQVLSGRRWYLLAWDLDRGEWRTFRLDRISDATATGERFSPRELPAATAAGYLDAAIKAPKHRAVITFLAPADQVADRLVNQDGSLEPLNDHTCRYTTWVDSFEWLAVTTTILGVDFKVDEPTGFLTYCKTLRDRLQRTVTPIAATTDA